MAPRSEAGQGSLARPVSWSGASDARRGGAGLSLIGTVSGGTLSTPSAPHAHELTPGFVYSGNYRSWGLPWFQTTTELFRVYVSTDAECVNRVYVGAVVGSPAYAPRFGHTLVLPPNQASLNQARGEWPQYGDEGQVLMLNGTPVKSVDSGALGTSGNTPKIDLWDTFWPEGGYYWTVIPVFMTNKRDNPEALEYRDIQLPEDVCRAGGAVRFGSDRFRPRTRKYQRPGLTGSTKAEMTWSEPVVLRISKPRFKIVKR